MIWTLFCPKIAELDANMRYLMLCQRSFWRLSNNFSEWYRILFEQRTVEQAVAYIWPYFRLTYPYVCISIVFIVDLLFAYCSLFSSCSASFLWRINHVHTCVNLLIFVACLLRSLAWYSWLYILFNFRVGSVSRARRFQPSRNWSFISIRVSSQSHGSQKQYSKSQYSERTGSCAMMTSNFIRKLAAYVLWRLCVLQTLPAMWTYDWVGWENR